ncbi:uncharacterized protein LOC124839814 [Vigna umbellata]|uniref:uncharacterized protein LOC124839814 n=1 Tax=Vigna umbellata TaxID=87088 RepID=UPI001F5E45ED|nr:uncharacterized protein LOC124839814 [Vigna umbellata]
MVELQNRANKFIHVEEMQAYQQVQKEEYARVVGHDHGRKDGKQAREQDEGRNFKRREFLKGPRYTRYTSLSATRMRVMEEALRADLLTLIQAPTPKNADGQKHCKYHQNLGHDTEDCGTLRDKLEELHSGSNGKRWEDRRGGRTATERSFKGHINTISWGFTGGGATSSARKRHLKSLRSANQAYVRQRSIPKITFSNEDCHAPDLNQDDLMVITAVIAQYTVAKVLIDQGSSANILYWKTFQQMNLSKDIIAPFNEQILGFVGERVDTRGYVDLRTSLGTERGAKELKVRFLLVEANTSYNALLGRPCLNAFRAIVSTPHLTLKYPSNEGRICTVNADQRMAWECYVAGLKMEPWTPRARARRVEVAMADMDPRTNTEDRMEPLGELQSCSLGEKEEQYTSIGGNLEDDQKEAIGGTLRDNKDLFAWTATDMPGIHPSIMSHKLSFFRAARPVAQKKQRPGEEKRRAVDEEVKKLMEGGSFER